MEKIKSVIDKIVEWICIGIMGLMTILVTYQVIVRYCFNNPSAITEVLSKYLFVWLVLYGAAYVFGLREHMNISYVRDKLPPKMKIWVEMIGEVIIVLFAVAVMCYGGYAGAVKQMAQLDSALQIPIGVIYSAIPISGVMIVFYFIYNEVKLWKQLRSIGK